MKTVNGHEIIQLFEQFSPKRLAMEGDKIGLQIGRLNRRVKNVLVALDVTEEVAKEALEKDVQLIIAHHPPIYRPLANIRTDTPQGRMIEILMKHEIAVYAAHTNLDVATGGLNDWLADALQLTDREVLVPTGEIPLKKLVVFAPVEDADRIRTAIGNAGAGAIGNYRHCSFTVEGTGRFQPGEDANPYIGSVGKLEAVREARIEAIFPENIEKALIKAMLQAHPYEEPAYDVYPLALEGEVYGLGRIGYLPEEMTLREFARFVKNVLDAKGVRVIGNLEEKVKKVAVLGGDGNKYYSWALRKGADVYVTGDMYYHTAIDAKNEGLNIVDPGHHVEQIMKKKVTEKMASICKEQGFDVNFIPSSVRTDPFEFL
ncbi:Nif3-like dinuclear metal center hexameric protein [Fervidibacillus halotolerans]|uniref:GTP cyclohydrolase 1 type 2 homolog n=1 Tax=Fervidibacillus halotolerans TaxID=2980027 RepID=A0A9E8M3K6_9BACI|nr:Nif3-like dinuclear metal center hexameric protein [Fervidibacillus halotolerans]WAA13931.1 Nif3-like dinuclear metal center hexameric protein [Fervidibacillus halotolerans]